MKTLATQSVQPRVILDGDMAIITTHSRQDLARSSASSRYLLTRPPIARMLEIHERLAAKVPVNCVALAREIEVNRRTIWRDVEFMRDRLGLPIDYDPQQHTFVYTEEVTGSCFAKHLGSVFGMVVTGKGVAA